MEENTNPLSILLRDQVETNAVTDRILSEILRQYVIVSREDGVIHFNEDADALSTVQKTLLVFLGHLAGNRILPTKIERPNLSQAEVIKFLLPHGMPEGTVKTNMKALRDRKLIQESSGSKGRYEISLSKLQTIKNIYFNGPRKN